ncbi:UNVERIFIED_CONTAM: Vacuolar protein sorting-associated protein 35 [Siphonaria sp. JEL0065]|nr:Vacuolar protein sorting-associated protein 35 [Siphonaria sp. JEL0065]
MNAAEVAQQQQKILDESLSIVKSQCLQMRRCLDNHRLMDALKHCSAMLAELKTATLAPKGYYELYMALFDQLRHLAAYLYDAHMSGRHHLSDLYELVQYAGSIVPRLYLMITVGSVFMRVSKELKAQLPPPNNKGKEPIRANDDSEKLHQRPQQQPINPIHDIPPIKELLKDMLDMTLGVQHPVRGLFLRYYLTSMCRDFMPGGEVEKEMERRELKLLVGSNLLRLSQIEGLSVNVFVHLILPSIMSEVVNCRDVMAQEYLMEVVIQVFPDDFHLYTLDLFLSATSQLSRNVNVKQTIMSLVNRFTAFARRGREEHAVKVKEAAAKGQKLAPISGIPDDVLLFEIFWEQVTQHIAVRPEFQLHDVITLLSSLVELSTGCYPTRYDYVDLILGYAKDRVMEVVVNKQPAMTQPETAAALLQLLLTVLSAYRTYPLVFLSFPSSSRNGGYRAVLASTSQQQQNTGLVMGGGSSQASSNANNGSPAPNSQQSYPAEASASLCGSFTDLLRLQPYSSRKKVALLFVDMCVNASNPLAKAAVKFKIDSLEAVDAVFGEICEVLVTDVIDGGLMGPRMVRTDDNSPSRKVGTVAEVSGAIDVVDYDSVVKEVGGVAKLVLLVGSESGRPDDDLELLGFVRNYISRGGEIRLKHSIPPIVFSCVTIARNYLGFTEFSDVTIIQRLNALFQFMNETVHTLRSSDKSQTISTASTRILNTAAAKEADALMKIAVLLPSTPTKSLNLYLAIAQSANECRNEEAAYEALVNAITTYEDYVTDTKAQVPALTALIGVIRSCGAGTLSLESYETIIGKVVVHCGRLLRKVDQCRCTLFAGHLYWIEERGAGDGVLDHPVNDEVLRANRAGSSGVGAAVAAATAAKKSKLSGLFGEEEQPEDSAAVAAAAAVPVKVSRDGKKVLECLQKALKIADSVLETSVNTELFVEILEQYIWFYESGNEYVNVNFLNSLIDLIQSNISNNSSVVSGSSTAVVPEKVIKHFGLILARLKVLKEEEYEERRQRGLDMTSDDVFGGDSAQGFGGVARSGGRWTHLEL